MNNHSSQPTFNPTPEMNKLAWKIVYFLVEARAVQSDLDEALVQLDEQMDRYVYSLEDDPKEPEEQSPAKTQPENISHPSPAGLSEAERNLHHGFFSASLASLSAAPFLPPEPSGDGAGEVFDSEDYPRVLPTCPGSLGQEWIDPNRLR